MLWNISSHAVFLMKNTFGLDIIEVKILHLSQKKNLRVVKITKVVQHYCQLIVYNLLVLTNQTYSKVMTFVCLKYLPSKHYREMHNLQKWLRTKVIVIGHKNQIKIHTYFCVNFFQIPHIWYKCFLFRS